MKLLHRVEIVLWVSIFFVSAGICLAQEQEQGKAGGKEWPGITESKVVAQVGDKGIINYQDSYIEAVGTGAPPDKYFGKHQARQKALRAAQIEAYRNLLETTQGVQIDSKTIVRDFTVESDKINAAVSGIVKGAQIFKKEYLDDGTVEVTVRMPMSGVAQIVLPKAIGDDKKKDFKQHKPLPFSKKSAPSDEVYTGLVIDGRGLQARPAMSPKVFDENGSEIYGTLIVEKEFAIKRGICGYARDLTAAQSNDRVTSKPLTVKAVRAQGIGMSEFVVSSEDADKIRSAKNNLAFLEKCRVIVVLD